MRFIIGVTSLPHMRTIIDTDVCDANDARFVSAFSDMSIGESRVAGAGFLTVVRVA